MNASFSLAKSRYSHSFPLGLGTSTKLLHYSDILSTCSATIIYHYCSHSSLSLKGCHNMFATCLGSAWYGLALSLTCNENVPLKQPMPVKTSLNSLFLDCVITVLAFISASISGLEINNFVFIFDTDHLIIILIFVCTWHIFYVLLINISGVPS